jgi:hypothetical protein
MKRLRIIGLALLALFALGAFAASMASAEEGLLPNATSSGSGKTTTLETTGKEKVSCTAVSILEAKFVPIIEKEKEIAKDQHGTANLHFTGCKAESLVPVQSLGDEKEVILSKVLFLYCLVEPTKLIFGLLIQSLETEHLEVPATKELVLVKGPVIAELETKALKAKEFSWNLVGAAGVQTTATKCVINGKEVKHTFESVNDKKTVDLPASENGLFTLKFPEEVTLEDS